MVVVALQTAAAAEKKHTAAAQDPGFFVSIGRWFDRQADSFKSTFGGARSTVEEFSHEAGVAASSTVDSAKHAAKDAAENAADAVGRLPSARLVSGYEKCRIAPNGAPNCAAAADAICRTKGFKTGSSVDMTSAEVCPPKIYLAGRSSGPGCHSETFVSSALCR